MNQRTLKRLAAVPVLLVTTVARAQAPATPPAADASPTATTTTPEPEPPAKPAAPPTSTPGAVNKFALSVYGFAELDAWYDTTQGAGEGLGNAILPRPGTVTGENGRYVWSARNSRFGFRITAPEWEGMKASAVLEADFGGNVSGGNVTAQLGSSSPNSGTGRVDAPAQQPYSNNYGNEGAFTLNGTLRLRHAYVKMETAYLDVLAGQTWDLFGWGTVPTLAGGPEFQGIPGQVYHRNPQLRLSQVFKADAVWVELAVAAVRPFQRDAQVPDVQGGLRVQFADIRGVHVVGAGKPLYSPMTFAVSGFYRSFKLVDHPPSTGGMLLPAGTMIPIDYVKKSGWGVAFDTFLPLYGATMESQSNALAVTGEVALTSGGADLYSGLSGNFAPAPMLLRAPVNAMPMATPPVAATPAGLYNQNFDNGVLAWDGTQFVPIKWLSITAGLQYHLPIYDGKLMWLTFNFGMVKLQDTGKYNLASSGTMNPDGTTTVQNAMKENRFIDATIFFSLGPAAHIAVNYANYQMTYMDGADSATNHRIMTAFYFFF
ncbi:MAG TPA: hypothetical protein VNO55_10940 [Polyangia bacterium]|nr:hypothetical protein [Polyangia bacterium]